MNKMLFEREAGAIRHGQSVTLELLETNINARRWSYSRHSHELFERGAEAIRTAFRA